MSGFEYIKFHKEEIQTCIMEAIEGKTPPHLSAVIYSLGRDAENEEEYTYAFNRLTSLADHPSVPVVADIIMAFSLLAVYHGYLDRKIVEPIIRKGYAMTEGEDRARIQDAIDDINYSLKWQLIL